MSDARMAPNPGTVTPHQVEHYFIPGCIRQGCVHTGTTDTTGFDDQDGWGYCDWCAFEVAAAGGKLLPHKRAVGGSSTQCAGSDMQASVQPSPEAKPKPLWFVVELEDEDDDDSDTPGSD